MSDDRRKAGGSNTGGRVVLLLLAALGVLIMLGYLRPWADGPPELETVEPASR